MVELTPTKHRSTNIHSVGFDGERRGDLHVQFKDAEGNLTTRGFYKDVPRAVFNGLMDDRSPGSFLNRHLKTRFEWVQTHNAGEEAPPEGLLEWPIPDEVYYPPDGFFIPAGTDAVEQYVECVNEQISRKAPRRGLFA